MFFSRNVSRFDYFFFALKEYYTNYKSNIHLFILHQGFKSFIVDFTRKEMNIKRFLSDAAKSIQNAAIRAFGQDLCLVMCFAHVFTNVDKQLKSQVKDKEDSESIKSDLRMLQLSQNCQVFVKASKLFIKKWSTKYQRLMEYFEQNWLKQNSNWFEGASPLYASTNNANEATNRWLKDNHLLRNRKSLSELKESCFGIVDFWGKVHHNFALEPLIKFKSWKKAALWSESSTKFLEDIESRRTWIEQNADEVEDDEDTNPELEIKNEVWYVAANQKNKQQISKSSIKKHKLMKWETFDEFRNVNFSVYRVNIQTPTTSTYFPSLCSCKNFFKNFHCEHSLGMLLKFKLINVPQKYARKLTQIEPRKKRGRPKKATPALMP